MKTKVTRSGDRWCFFLEAKVSLKHYIIDPREEAYDVLGRMAKEAEGAFDKALEGTEFVRAGEVSALLAWDKKDPETAGHPWAEPDPRDDFPGLCPYPGCSAHNVPGKRSCEAHRCSKCGGTGYAYFAPHEYEKCKACDGKGRKVFR